MKIIIAGCGKVGYTIAKSLSAESWTDVTIIDVRNEAFDKAAESMDAMLVKGDVLSAQTLIEAGASSADLFIGVTEADEKNILCCILAKHLGAEYTIARVRDPRHSAGYNKFWMDLGLDLLINPEQETAREISRLLRFPSAEDIDTFVEGRDRKSVV